MPTQCVARRWRVGLGSVNKVYFFNKCSLSRYYYVLGFVDIDRNKTWPLPQKDSKSSQGNTLPS